MEQVQIFKHERFGQVRTVTIDGITYFVGKDVAIALGYSNPQKALRDHVEPEDKMVNESFTLGQGSAPVLITESGLYSLILSSKLPQAKQFKRWVTNEVLPTIRRTGAYVSTASKKDIKILKQLATDPEFIIQMGLSLQAAQDEVKRLTEEIETLKPQVDFCQTILNCPNNVSVTTIAKDYGMSARAFNQMLNRLGVQFCQGGVWFLYQPYADLGWTQSKTHQYLKSDGTFGCKVMTYWTQKGRLGLYDFLKKHGILPVVEREDELDF